MADPRGPRGGAGGGRRRGLREGAGIAALRRELRPSRLIPTVTAGLVIGVLEVVLAASFTALVFREDASVHVPVALGLSLFAGAAVLTAIAFGSSLPGVVGSLQDTTAVILGLITAAITVEMPGALHDTFLTLVAVIIVSSLLTGVFLLVLGRLRLGNLVRFIPYPVVGGFLAGTGWLLFKGGIGILAGRSLTLQSLHRFVRPDPMLKWIPGVAFAVILLLILRRYRHFLIVPVAVALGVAVFYVVLYATDKTVLTAKIHGFLLGPFPYGEDLWDPATLDALTGADWGAVAGQAAGILAIPLVAVLALLLNASGIELAREADADLNRELTAAGVGNIAVSAMGGIPGFQALSLSALAQRTGTTSRLVGVVAAAVCATTLVFGAGILSLFPRMVLGGLVVFLGLAFLVEWVIDARPRLPRRDYLVVLLILVSVAAIGFLPGVGVGLVAAIVLFVVDYSKTNVVRHTLSGSVYRSRVERTPRDTEALRREGEAIFILELEGFVFFGTANSLLERIRARAADPGLPALRFLILDFRQVIGIDSSAVLSFTKALQLAESRPFTLVLTDLEAPVRRQLELGGLDAEAHETLRVFPDLDHGLQWCEDQILRAAPTPGAGPGVPLAAQLRDELGGEVDAERLMAYLEPVHLAAGEEFIRQGDSSEDLYFLESGRLTAQMVRDDGEVVRLQTMNPGTVVGEITMYLGTERTASVVSDEASTVHRLTRARLEEMERGDPELAAAVHRLFARLLAERLTSALRTMNELLD